MSCADSELTLGVTHSQIEFSEYFEPIQKYGPVECISNIADAVQAIDKILDIGGPAARALRSLFGLGDLSDDTDFVDVVQSPLGFWQAQNWDPDFGSDGFTQFCDALAQDSIPIKSRFTRIPAVVVNYAKFVRENIVAQCPRSVEECFGTQNDTAFQSTDLDQTWRLWEFQVCTQWGYFQSAPKDGPQIMSKRINLEYTSKLCKQAFLPGKHFSVPEWPDVDSVNRRGDFAIEMDRLAFIDGDRDPWRPAVGHANRNYTDLQTPGSDLAPRRKSTVNKPVHVIFGGSQVGDLADVLRRNSPLRRGEPLTA